MRYKVLLPFNGSRCSVKAAQYVAQLMFSGKDISCTVLFVIPFTRELAGFLGMLDHEYNMRFGELAEKMKEKVSYIFESRGLLVETVLMEGDPVKVICEVARREYYSEIVMGSRGYTGIKKIINGNFSQAVARKAACPVKIIK